MSLNPYSGPWDKDNISHLLRRVTFSYRPHHVEEAINDGIDKTIEKVLELNGEVELPLNYGFELDPEVPIGESWVNAGYTAVNGLNRYRSLSLAGWIISRNLLDSISVQEKMSLFWHNHFPIADVNDARFLYRYYSLLRNNALGDFKQLVKDVTIDPSMLRYLNGNQNTKAAPNENYARELLELFTIGKGENVGDGDYTTFTEQDVQAIAKVLTGWRDRGHLNANGQPVESYYTQNRHDTSSKQLSHRFDNVVIDNQNQEEYKVLIDIIFQKEEVSKFMVRKFYRWFVHYNITEQIELDIIEPLAKIFRDNNYEVKPVLETLLKSEHFYTGDHVGCMIKSPMDYILNGFGLFDVDTSYPELVNQYTLWVGIFNGVNEIQQKMFDLPTVAGWKAYYQEPVYYRYWLNSVTLPLRNTIQVILWIEGFNTNGAGKFKFDPFKVIEKVSEPLDINILIEETSSLVFPRPLTQNQKDYLKEVVLQGLPDFEWTVEYADYLANPNDNGIKASINAKLSLLFLSMCQLPEYHLS